MTYRMTITEDQLEFIIQECKTDLEFSDWQLGSDIFQARDARAILTIVGLLAKAMELKEKGNGS